MNHKCCKYLKSCCVIFHSLNRVNISLAITMGVLVRNAYKPHAFSVIGLFSTTGMFFF